jgi:hypothetical protein
VLLACTVPRGGSRPPALPLPPSRPVGRRSPMARATVVVLLRKTGQRPRGATSATWLPRSRWQAALGMPVLAVLRCRWRRRRLRSEVSSQGDQRALPASSRGRLPSFGASTTD